MGTGDHSALRTMRSRGLHSGARSVSHEAFALGALDAVVAGQADRPIGRLFGGVFLVQAEHPAANACFGP